MTTRTQQELKALRAKVERRREYLDILELELFNTRTMLLEFTRVYGRRIGPLEREYQRLETLLEREDDPYRPPKPGRKKGQTNHKQRHAPPADDQTAEDTPPPQTKYSKRKITRDPDFEQQIRELFHNLAKRFHPDLSDTEEDRAQREKIMAQINEAYTSRDIGTLQSLAKMAKAGTNGSNGPEAELASLKIELRNLDGMIFEVEHTIREIDNSPAMQMRTDMNIETQTGRNMMEDLANSLRQRIKELREYLIELGVEPESVYPKKNN